MVAPPKSLLIESKTKDFILTSSEIEGNLQCDRQFVEYKLPQWDKRVNAVPGFWWRSQNSNQVHNYYIWYYYGNSMVLRSSPEK